MQKLFIILAIVCFLPLTSTAGTVTWDWVGDDPDGFVIKFWDRANPPANTMDWNDPLLYYIHIPDGSARTVGFDDNNLFSTVDYAFFGHAYLNQGGISVESAEADKTAWGGGTFTPETFTWSGPDVKLPPIVIKPNSITITIE